MRTFPQFLWNDALPQWRKPYVEPLTPTVHVEQQGSDGRWAPLVVAGVPENDGGLHFVTIARTVNPPTSHWASIWMTPPGVDPHANYRFAVRTLQQQTICSQPFRLPAAAPLVAAPHCD